MHGLEPRYADRIRFVYLDTDDPAVTPFEKELLFRGMPHLILLDAEGRRVKEWYGLVKQETLSQAFDALLAGEPVP